MTNWTTRQKLTFLMALPWDVRVSDEDGDMIASVTELPEVVATGATERELHVDLFGAIEAVLDVKLQHGDAIALPRGAVPPWDRNVAPPTVPQDVVIYATQASQLRTMSTGATRSAWTQAALI